MLAVKRATAVSRCGLMLLIALGAGACAEGQGGNIETQPLAVRVESVLADFVLPGTRALVRGDGFLEGAEVDVSLRGTASGVPTELYLTAERVDDRTLAVVFPPEQVLPLGTADFTGELRVEVTIGAAAGEGLASVTLRVRPEITPNLAQIPPGVFPQTPVVVVGDGFLLPGEGSSLVSFRGLFTPEAGGPPVELAVTEAPLVPAGPGDAAFVLPDRTRSAFTFDPAWVGIAPGRFEGEVQIANRGLGWTQSTAWTPTAFDLLPPLIEGVSPTEASRGQRIDIQGQGFLGGEAGATFIRLEGDFQPDVGDARPLPPGGLELSPQWIDGNHTAFAMRVHYDADCNSRDLGATPGTMTGTATAVITRGDVTVEGASFPVTFRIRPSRQVVWLRFLPAFTDSLRIFGLRNVSGAVQNRVLEVLRRDYSGIGLDFRLVEPKDFLDYSIVEIGGPDPNGQHLFGLDNTPDLDHCNERLADNLAGRNADGAGYGGIFVESFLQFSPARSSENPLADPAFDEIFGPVMARAVEPGEYPDGPRSAAIAQAILTLGSLIGNTATHEVGHSLGLPVFPGCGEYHTAPGQRQIMDCGADRPFSERAELDASPATFNPEDFEYLQRVLPP
jgi:hypothetical protein